MTRCRDCRHFYRGDDYKRCGHLLSPETDAIGDLHYRPAATMRMTGPCGPDAKLFAPIPVSPRKWPKVLAVIAVIFSFAAISYAWGWM